MSSGKELVDALRKKKEVELSVKGRRSGRMIPRPVWFALSRDGRSMFLIPVNGTKTQWYLNVRKDPVVSITVGGRSFGGRLSVVGESKFREALDAFKARYGDRDMKEYYPNLDVALELPLPVHS